MKRWRSRAIRPRPGVPVLIALCALSGCSGPDADLPPPYRTLAVPQRVAALAPEAVARGREVYLGSCALCHGERADGRGVRQNLSSHPRDFTRPDWCRRASARRIFHAVREGVPGTAMPAWKALDEEPSWDVVAYLLSVCRQGPAGAG